VIRDAVVLASERDATHRVGGVPLLVRTALVLQRAGIERIVVDGAGAPADPRIGVAVTREPLPPGTPHVVIGPGAVIDQPLAEAALGARGSVRVERDGAWLEVRRGEAPISSAEPWPGTLATVCVGIEQTLLRRLENPRDGYLDRVIHRHASRPLTVRLLSTALTPNQVTIVGVVIGIAGGLLVGSPSTAGVLAGVVALLLSGILDCCDGEIARIRFTESRVGHLLDIVGDTLVHAALLAGIARHLAHRGAWPGLPTLGMLAVGVVASFAAITWSEATETRRHRAAGAWENRVLENVLSPLTTRDWYVFPVAFALAGRLDALVVAAAWGAQAFWIVVVTLVARVMRRV
jgi:phosphatidylglycerophosphate synthase